MLRFIAILVLLTFSARSVAAEPDPAVAEKLVADALKAWDVPGVAVVVVRGDDTLLLKGFGKRELGAAAPVTADTVFPLASCSKAFTTTLLAMLADDGAMNWDDSVHKHLSGFKLSDPNADALLTMRDLLCHRCGIGGHDILWYRAPWGIDETLKRAQLLPLDYPFRSGFQYSSIPYLAAGRAIEKRTGEKWEKLVRTRICEPLGMKGVTFTTIAIPKDADRASGHKLGKDGKVGRVPGYEIREPNPSGSVNATATDVAAWLKFHLSDGLDPNGTRLVSIKHLDETKTPQNIIRLEGLAKQLNPDTVQLSYAMGWLVYDHRGKKVISHGGMIDGFRVQITMLPNENLGIAVLANLQETRMNAALTNSLIDLYCGLPAKDWNAYFRKIVEQEAADRKATLEARNAARDPNAKPTLPLTGYAGEYTHPAYGSLKVAIVNGRLVLTWGGFECVLEHFEADTFRITEGFFADRLVPFTVADGKATRLKFSDQQFERK
ncbi:MAG: serine hydrolase [Planctomycetes bacterium]|nr:serine hydrolase [Planctomycetota bacterium]